MAGTTDISLWSTRRAWAALLLGAVLLVLGARAALGGSALQADPGVLSGSLENGVSYFVQRRANAPGNGVAVRALISGGTLDERDEERGAAHIVSKMVFAESERFEAGEARRLFADLGVELTRARSVSVREGETVYSIDAQRDLDRAVRLSVRLIGDVLDGLAFDPGLVEQERRRELREAQLYRGDLRGARDGLYARLLPGSGLSERPVIAHPETIAGVSGAALASYHARVFSPERLTLVIVGDVDPDRVVRVIEEELGAVDGDRGGEAASPEWDVASGFAAPVMTTAYAGDPEAVVELLVAEEPRGAVVTRKQFADGVVRDLAIEAMRVRMRRLVLNGDVPAREVGANSWDIPGALRLTGLSATLKPNRWAQGVTALVREVERVRRYGFSPIDLDGARARVVSIAENRARSAPARSNARAAGEILARARFGSTVVSSAYAYELTTQIAGLTDDAAIDRAFSELFRPREWCALVVAPPESVPSEADLHAMVDSAMRHVAPDADGAALAVPSLDIAGKFEPAPISEIAFDPRSGITSAVLGNGVTVHHKQMDSAKNKVVVGLALIGGRIDETHDTRGATDAVASIWDAPVWCGTSIAAVDAALAGREIRFENEVYSDALQLVTHCPPGELEAALSVLTSTIREPFIDGRSLERWREGVIAQAERRRTRPGWMLSEVFTEAVHRSGDPRFGMLDAEDAERVDLLLAQQWADDLLDRAPIEMIVVGDIDRASAFELVASTIGGLPERARVGRNGVVASFDGSAVDGSIEVHTTCDEGADHSIVLVGYRGAEYRDRPGYHKLGVLRYVMQARLSETLQERQQAASWVGGGVAPALTHGLSGMFWAGAAVQADEIAVVGKELLGAFDELERESISESELESARQLALRDARTRLDDPAHWARIGCDMRYRGASAGEEARAMEIIRATDEGVLKKTLAALRTADRQIVITITPEERD